MRKLNQEHKDKIAASHRGKKHSPETIEKIKQAIMKSYNFKNGLPILRVPKPIKVKRETRGTTYSKSGNNWKVQFKENGKLRYIGVFATEEEAHVAYLAAKGCAEVPTGGSDHLTHRDSRANSSICNLGTKETQESV